MEKIEKARKVKLSESLEVDPIAEAFKGTISEVTADAPVPIISPGSPEAARLKDRPAAIKMLERFKPKGPAN